ncbi:MAG: hypothetical protein HZA79_11240 [Sphingobacteriales bacterium]|nr:hypothetical protein [Sphingobacteriales bacterium]
MRKSILSTVVLSLFLLVPASIIWAQTISSQKGLTTAIFTTNFGLVKIYLPDDIRPGDHVTGTIIAEPSGRNASQLEKNRSALRNQQLLIGGNKYPVPETKSVFSWVIPQDGPAAALVELLAENGNKAGEVSINIKNSGTYPSYPGGCVIPSHVLTAAPLRISGSFDGDLSNTRVSLQERPLEVIAESPRECLVQFPAEGQGSHTLQVSENGQSKCTQKISGVDMEVTTGKLKLKKGEGTYIDIKLTGLQNLPDKAVLTIINNTPGIVRMTNGNNQVIPVWPPSDSAAGVFIVHCPAVSITTGDFEVNINLDLPEPGVTATSSGDLPPGYTRRSCQCSAAVSITKSDNRYTAVVSPACTGVYGVGINTFSACSVKSVTYAWSFKSGAENAELVGKTDGNTVTVRNKNRNGFVLCVTVTVTCIDGSVCSATECAEQPGETVVTGSRCACSASCSIVASARDHDHVTYTGIVKAECKGTAGTGSTRVACSVGPVTYHWSIGESGKEVAEISGKADGPAVTVKLKKKGPYNLYLSGTVTCSDGTVCEYSCNIEVPDEPTTTGKFCNLEPQEKREPLMDGGFNQKYRLTEKLIRRDDYIVLGAEGQDWDMLTWKCKPVKPDCPDTESEKTILLSSRVRFEWEILSGEGSLVKLGCLPDGQKSDRGDVIIFRPPALALPVKAADTIVTTVIKLLIIDDNASQPEDPTVEKIVTITTKRGRGYPDHYKINVTGDAMRAPDKRIPAPVPGSCSAEGPDWEKLTPISPDPPEILLPGVADNDKMVTGQWIVLQTGDVRDMDKLTIRCLSRNNCPTQPWIKEYEDAPEWEWSKTGAGRFITELNRQFIFYEAPLEIPAGQDFVDVEFKVIVKNTGGKINDKNTKEGKKKIRIFRAGVKLSHPPLAWLPEEDNFIELVSELMYKDGDWKPALAHMCRIHYFELLNVSREKGVCLNSPVPREADPCHDLYFKKGEAPEVFDDRSVSNCSIKNLFQQARSPVAAKQYSIKVYSRDFGAYGFLRSFANINKGGRDSIKGEKPVYEPVPAHVSHTLVHPQGRSKKTLYRDNRVTLPHDIDENQLPDAGWQVQGGVRVPDPPDKGADEDDLPAGDGFNGDGLSNYEEYRGFKVMDNGKEVHIRTHHSVKDIFIRNRDNLDLSLYAGVSELDVHEIEERQYVDDRYRIVNANNNRATHASDQRGLKLINAGTHPALLGVAISEGALTPTVPNFEAEIRVYLTRIQKAIRDRNIPDAAAKIRAVVSHELLHGNNVCHHGEGDESAENSFDRVHGLRSGDTSCVMRYDNVGTVIRGFDPEAVGTDLCDSAAGTGYNAHDQHFGNANAGRGNCKQQVRVSGKAGRPKPCGNR